MSPVSAWNLFRNPIFMKCVRSRLRPRHVFTYSIISLVVSGFVFLSVFLTTTERGFMDSAMGAKAALLPLLIVQGIILMLLGTGSIAAGIAVERDAGVLDYQRMAPMSTASKIVGYLFGLPVREWVMFIMTLPFLGCAIVLGDIPIMKVVYLYTAFFSAAILYHLTGFCAGMLSKKPRRANWGVIVWVFFLYVFLPGIARTGFTFLEFLTVRPTVFGMVQEEMFVNMSEWEARELGIQARRWEEVSFFGLDVGPLAFSLIIQGAVSVAFLVVITRKWRQETLHAFPKSFGVGLCAAFQVLVLGSLWPIFSTPHDQVLRDVAEPGFAAGFRGAPPVHSLTTQESTVNSAIASGTLAGRPLTLLYIFFFLAGLMGLLLILTTAPSGSTYVKGLRRSRKLGGSGVPLLSDAATSLWPVIVTSLLVCGSYFALTWLARENGHMDPLGLWPVVAPALLFVTLMAYTAAVREVWGTRGLILFAFAIWIIPFMINLILMAAWDRFVAAGYTASPSPPMAFVFALANMTSDAREILPREQLEEHVPRYVGLGVAFNVGLSAVFLAWLAWLRSSVRKHEDVQSTAAAG